MMANQGTDARREGETMKIEEISRGMLVRVRGIHGEARVLECWSIGSETFVKLGFYRPRSGKCCAVRTETPENILPIQ